ncbi:MAG: RNA polymerase sigma factor [Bacteroidales bacterium]|nr:RNA polymerase sigma factor [Bacteroidales bacterium]
MDNIQIVEIIKGCISGKRKAQKKLYDLFSDDLFGICLYYSKNRDEAEDVLHEGFMKVYNNISTFKHKSSLFSWMKKIIINTALERYRKQYYLTPVTDLSENIEDIDRENVINHLSSKDLIKLIQDLSPKYRMVFNMYAIEGYSHKEISKKLNISEGTSKSNLSRARAILQNKVRKYFYMEIKKA